MSDKISTQSGIDLYKYRTFCFWTVQQMTQLCSSLDFSIFVSYVDLRSFLLDAHGKSLTVLC